MRGRAFTLIELLVVVAIITALLALLVPSMNRATYVARSATCLNARHQWHIGVAAYSQDSLGRFPNWKRGSLIRGPHDIEWFMPAVLWRDYQVPPAQWLCQLADEAAQDAFDAQFESRLNADPGLTAGNPKVFFYDYARQVGWPAYWVQRGAAGEYAAVNPNIHSVSDRVSQQPHDAALLTDPVTLVGSGATAKYISDHQFNGATLEASAVYVHGGASLTPVGQMEIRYSWWRPPYVW